MSINVIYLLNNEGNSYVIYAMYPKDTGRLLWVTYAWPWLLASSGAPVPVALRCTAATLGYNDIEWLYVPLT